MFQLEITEIRIKSIDIPSGTRIKLNVADFLCKSKVVRYLLSVSEVFGHWGHTIPSIFWSII
jgi:hypothetical protein